MKRRLLLLAASTPSQPHWPAWPAAPASRSTTTPRKTGAGPAPYFNGTLDAWGVFTDRSGKVVKRFTVVMNCSWQGNDGVLDEDFTYSDGTKQRRIWRLKLPGRRQLHRPRRRRGGRGHAGRSAATPSLDLHDGAACGRAGRTRSSLTTGCT
jgi:hypothetical protein